MNIHVPVGFTLLNDLGRIGQFSGTRGTRSDGKWSRSFAREYWWTASEEECLVGRPRSSLCARVNQKVTWICVSHHDPFLPFLSTINHLRPDCSTGYNVLKSIKCLVQLACLAVAYDESPSQAEISKPLRSVAHSLCIQYLLCLNLNGRCIDTLQTCCE